MPTTQLHAQAAAVRADLTRLESDLKALLTTVGGSIGSAIHGRVAEPLKTLSGHVEPLLNLLGAAGGPAAPVKRGPRRPRKEAAAPVPAKRGPGRPRKDATAVAPPAAAPKRRKGGGRGRKANLTIESITAALTKSNWNKSAAARALGVSQPTLYKYLGAFKIGAVAKAPATPVKRGPGRPRKATVTTAAPLKSNKQATGGRGTKANLTADAIQAALKQTGGVKSRAADVLGVSQPTLYNYLKALGLAARKAVGRGSKKGKKAT